jgi:RNA polymerase sigma-70 factor (ECF subfamily)
VRSDQEIVQACLAGESDAFATIVERYGSRVYNLALRIVRDPDAASDCAQEAFVRAYRALHRYDPSRPFAPWMYRIATNASLNYAQRWHAHEQPVEELPERVEPEELSPEATALRREELGEVLAAIDALPTRYRAALVLRHVHELSYQEVADALDMPIGTVKTHLFRARAALRTELRRRGLLREDA